MGNHVADKISACYWSGDAEKGVGNKDDSFEGVTKVEDDGWDVAMKAMNKALEGTEYSQYKWVKNEGEDAKSRPLVIKMQPQTQP